MAAKRKKKLDLNDEDFLIHLKEENHKMVEKDLGDEIENAIGKIFGPASQERAIPNIKDGLMPVYKRILLTIMWNNYYYKEGDGTGSSNIVGYTLSKLHPHGDASIYGSMVRMAQDFCMPSPRMVSGVGNFGSQAGDEAASYRYTKASGTPFLHDCIHDDLSKKTVDFELGENQVTLEPSYLPTKLPLSLLYTNYGIAHGFITSTPSHNLGDIVDVCIRYIRNKEITPEALCRNFYPDYVTGGVITNKEEIKDIYLTGSGAIKLNAKIEICHQVEDKRGNKENYIIIHEIPHGIPYDSIYDDIVKQVKIKNNIILSKITLPLILTDENDNMIWKIDCPSTLSEQDMKNIVSELLNKTGLSNRISIKMNFMKNRSIRNYTLKDIISTWYNIRSDVVYRSLTAKVSELKIEKHIVEGLLVLSNKIDEVVKFIRNECASKKDIINKLPSKFNISMKQAAHIAEQQLHVLTNMTQSNILERYEKVNQDIEVTEKQFDSIDQIIIDSLLYMKRKYAVPRRTTIMESCEAEELSQNTISDSVILTGHGGYGVYDFNTLINSKNITNGLKSVRIDNKSYKGIINVDRINENADYLLITFSDGTCKKISVQNISMLNSWENININNNTFITNVIGFSKDDQLLIINDQAKIKLIDHEGLSDGRLVKIGGIKFITFVSKDTFENYDLVLMNDKAMYCCFENINDIPLVGKNSSGVLTKFKNTDEIFGCFISKSQGLESIVVSYTLDGETGYVQGYQNDKFVRTTKNHALKKLFNLSGSVLGINQIELKKNSIIVMIGDNNIMKNKPNQFNASHDIPKKTGLKVISLLSLNNE